MNRKRLVPLATLMLFTIIFISGCKKMVHQNIQAASNSSVAISAYNDVFEQLNAAVDSSLDQKTVSTWNLAGTVCADVSLSSLGIAFPKTLTIHYGSECIDAEGISRTGKIVAVFSGNFRDENTTISLSFEEFSVGQYSLAGTDSITNNGVDASGNPLFSEVLRNAVISWGNQNIRWNADLIRTWIEGYTTDFATDTFAGLNDDVYELTGSASGNDSNTHPFTLETTSSLVLQTSCEYITEGMLVISPANFNDGTVDYGIGECDKQATIEVDGEVFNFTQ
ncbi:hypothetical protein N9J52_02690 [Flavobacteriales bacterium]|nr:hypothetical protein [Flavobacteriales bacterium]